MKKYKIYYAIGETKRDYVDLSFSYKIKFVYYMILSFFNLIKLIMMLIKNMNVMNTAIACHVSVISEDFFLMGHFWGVTTCFYVTTSI